MSSIAGAGAPWPPQPQLVAQPPQQLLQLEAQQLFFLWQPKIKSSSEVRFFLQHDFWQQLCSQPQADSHPQALWQSLGQQLCSQPQADSHPQVLQQSLGQQLCSQPQADSQPQALWQSLGQQLCSQPQADSHPQALWQSLGQQDCSQPQADWQELQQELAQQLEWQFARRPSIWSRSVAPKLEELKPMVSMSAAIKAVHFIETRLLYGVT